MTKLVVAKFGGSTIGADGVFIPEIIKRINDLKKDSKVIAVFSAHQTMVNVK
jgi:aspartate kinase